ncbi:hypothetical protein Trydic_g23329 [Trypoxylus dichotomus]
MHNTISPVSHNPEEENENCSTACKEDNNTRGPAKDGAPPYYGIAVKTFLNNVSPGRWIRHRMRIGLSSRSPDLTPLDFFLWDHLKNKVYVNRSNNMEGLTARRLD